MKIRLILLLLFLQACSEKSTSKKKLWFGDSEGSPFQLLNQVKNQKKQNELVMGADQIVIIKQNINDIPVQSSYVKTIISQKKINYLNATYEDAFSEKLKKEIHRLKKFSDRDLRNLILENNLFLKDKKLAQQPYLEIRKIDDILTPVFVYNVVDLNGIQSWIYNSHFKLIRTELIGSHFANAKAHVYPNGPKFSELSFVILNSLTEGSSGLIGNQIKVNTESNDKVNFSENLNFNPPDEKFDQVQVYYYLQKALTWFEDVIKIPKNKLALNAVTHFGYPENTNAAFYFNGLIRLGYGDGEYFSNIAYDPSIVIHEASHAVVELLASLPYQNEGGSLNEGFADLISCLILNNPRLGEVSFKKSDFKRDISLVVKFKEKTGGLYHDSAIVSSFFWNLKNEIGAPKTIQFAMNVLKKLTPFTQFSDYQIILEKSIELELANEDQAQALKLYKNWTEE